VLRSVAAQPGEPPNPTTASTATLKPARDTAAIATEVLDFILERLRAMFLDAGRGVTTEMFDAVLASGSSSPLDIDARLRALGAFLAQPEGASLAAANKRIANILRKSETAVATDAAVDASALVEPAEQALHAAVAALRADVTTALARRDYAAALARLASLRPAVDAFFDAVMVNDPDARLRANRLALLGNVRGLFAGVADLSKLPG
jgi:glycyl-tRNA synthetase beta chain